MLLILNDIIKYINILTGREEGIRTLESLHPTRVPGVRLKPLGHLSIHQKIPISSLFILKNQLCSFTNKNNLYEV